MKNITHRFSLSLNKKRLRLDEKGFTYPLTFVFLILTSLFLLAGTTQFLAEKKFAKETESIRIQEYYFFMAVKRAEEWMREEKMPIEGEWVYKSGSMQYVRKSVSLNREQIIFTLKLTNGDVLTGIGEYDKEKKKMVKWVEKI